MNTIRGAPVLHCESALNGRVATVERPDDLAGLRVHMIGVGGCGMSGAAALLLAREAIVSGSDQNAFDACPVLRERGATIFLGHDARHLPPEVELVVISAAIPESNPELIAARRRDLPVIRYAELLGRLMKSRRGIAIAGTHGKSTTTAMLAHIFRTAGLAPSFVVGARSEQLGGSSSAGAGPHFIVEACEYARSFLELRPRIAAILNIEADHLDCYRDIQEIRAAFASFGTNLRPGSLLVTSYDDRSVAEAATNLGVRHQTFALRGAADWTVGELRAVHGCYAFTVLYRGQKLFGRRVVKLRLAGVHNVCNALAAVALAHEEGVTSKAIIAGLESFLGVDRRMTRRGERGGVTIVDDYAHHPTEIRVTLEAIRDRYQPKRCWVIFQPHQASRTRQLMHEFAGSFSAADMVIVADIYSVRDSEHDRLGTKSSELATLIHDRGGNARYIGGMAEVTRHVEENVIAGDLVVTMGAGDVWKIADDLVRRVRRAS